MDRIITYHEGASGPLFVVTAAMHGNEQAGVKALDYLGELFKNKSTAQKDFILNGTFIGMLGNIQAMQQNIRYISHDLNRMWETDFVYSVLEESPDKQVDEVREMHEIIITLRNIVLTGKYSKLYLLDLHTTSSEGIFTICTEDKESVEIANQLHAPVVRGLLKGIAGTTLHYFNRNNLGITATALAFEAGKHDDPLSVQRSMAAVINCMRTVGCIHEEDVENEFDELLINYSKNLPKCVEVIFKHHIKDPLQWQMMPGFANFDSVKKGQILAHDENGDVLCPDDGLILMPLYQSKGRDGFFIVKPL